MSDDPLAIAEYRPGVSAVLSDAERWPTLTPDGAARLAALRHHPAAPRWTHATGDRLTAEQIEPLEAMVEATTALCCCPVEHTGRIEVSLDLLEREGIPVRTLDATGIYADSGYSSG